MAIFLGLSLLLPLVLSLAAWSGRYPGLGQWWWLAPLPMGMTALLPAGELNLPWLVVGMHFHLDTLARSFSLLSVVIWSVAGWQLRRYSPDPQLQGYFGLTLAGNLGVISAADMVSFYTCFSLMALAAYGMLRPFPGAQRGARWYLALAIVGELALLGGIFLVAPGGVLFSDIATTLANHPQQSLVVGLFYLAFAIKVGNVPLHSWLPLAYGSGHPVTTLVFGGVITNLGILGWCRFLAPGDWSSVEWGSWFIAVGLFSALYCAVMGSFQRRPRTLLGYSSASQMGLATALVGIALTQPTEWPWLQWVLVIFSLHHGVIKAGLMLAARQGLPQGVYWLLLSMGALALAGLPPTGGWLVKHLMKTAAGVAPHPWSGELTTLLTISSITSGLLMLRFLRTLTRSSQPMDATSARLLILSLLIWPLGFSQLPALTPSVLTGKSIIQALMPLLLATLLVATLRLLALKLRVGEGDIALPLGRIRLPHGRGGWLLKPQHGTPPLWRWLALGERRLRRTQIAGLLLLGLLGALVTLLAP